MNGEIYRQNIRFDLADEPQRSIVEQLQSIDRKQYGSINKFIIAAIGKAFDSNGSSTLTVRKSAALSGRNCRMLPLYQRSRRRRKQSSRH